jgi:hypothetical protein
VTGDIERAALVSEEAAVRTREDAIEFPLDIHNASGRVMSSPRLDGNAYRFRLASPTGFENA